jgi:transposase
MTTILLFAMVNQISPASGKTYESENAGVGIRGTGPEFASVLSLEAFYRNFANRREVAAYAGLVPSPWKSGSIDV